MLSKLKSIDEKLSPGLRKIIHNIGWLSAERILSMMLSFFVGVYVIRYLGAENFGKLSYSISFVALFTAISKVGLDQIVVRNLVKQKHSTFEILGTAFILKVIGSICAFCLIYMTIVQSTNDIKIQRMTVIIALGLILSSFDILDLWFQSQVLSKSIVIVRSSQFIISSFAKLSFIFFKLPLIAFAYLLLIDSILRAVGMIVVYFQHGQSIFRWKFKKLSARNLLRDSWPLILAGVMVNLYLRIDQIMIGNMASSQEVGIYAVSVRFSEIWYFIPTAICSSVFPSIIKAKNRSKKEYYTKLQQLYDLMVWIALLIAIIGTFLSSSLIISLVGKEYIKSGPILSIHIWAGIFVFLGIARSQWLINENLTKFTFLTNLSGTICNLFLNYLLIPYYGGLGAAWATIVSYAFTVYFSCFIYKPLFNIGSMLTKALIVPFRIKHNLKYFMVIKNQFFSL